MGHTAARRAAPALAIILVLGTRGARADERPGDAAASADVTTRPSPSLYSTMAARSGLQLGARVGYALPSGRLGGAGGASANLSSMETAVVPVGLDAGYRVTPRTYVGGTFVWGPGTAPSGTTPCTATGVSCSRQEAQLRGEARFYFAPDAKVGGWLAVGGGWEVARFGQTAGGTTITATRTGFVFPDMQLGFDVRRDATAVGLYFGLSLASFLTQGLDPASSPVPTWSGDSGVHTWVTLGVRGSYGPW